MKHALLTLALASCLAGTAAQAAMNPNPLGLPTSHETKTANKSNLVELHLGGGTVGDYFGESSGPVVSAMYERRMSENMSLGVEVSRSTTKYSVLSFSGEYGYKYTHNGVAGRASYHMPDFFDDERIDLYGGGRLGYNTFSMSAFGPSVQEPLGSTSYAVVGGYTGGRFWFKPTLGVNAEFGYNYAMYSYATYGGLSWGTASLGISLGF